MEPGIPDAYWEDRYYNDSDRQADDAADADIDVNWDDVSSDSSVHGHRGRDDESSNRSQPATKRSRSTQVSDEFVKRSVEPSPEATTGTATNDNHLTQLQRLEVIVDLLESLARSGLPTLINSFQRSGDFTKLHTVFHTDASTASFPRVGNWNLALVGSLLCPPLRGIYNNAGAFGSFMEAFTVCQARLQTRPRWFETNNIKGSSPLSTPLWPPALQPHMTPCSGKSTRLSSYMWSGSMREPKPLHLVKPETAA